MLALNLVFALAAALPKCHSTSAIKNAVIISIDGLHQGDLDYLVKHNPTSNLAQLAQTGATFTDAMAPYPSDSFPGLADILTGASPKTHGFYYDVPFARDFYAVGDSTCSGPIGNAFAYDESVEIATAADGTVTRLDGGCDGFNFGNGCGIDPKKLPYKKVNGVCTAWYPHMEIKANTIYEVAKSQGYFTAHADKHLVYEFVNGNSGNGVIDLYTPEIAFYSNGLNNTSTYDDLHLDAVLNWVSGRDSHGNTINGTYKGFVVGSNFQVVSVEQKIAGKEVGGYVDAQFTPSANLAAAIAHMDDSIGKIVQALKSNGIFDQTLLVISSKHGQGPVNPTLTKKIGDSDLSDLVSNYGSLPADSFAFTNDDGSMIWYRDSAQAGPACNRLKANATLIGADGPSAKILCGADIIKTFGADPASDAKVPDIAIITNPGVIYTTSKKKNMEHGGGSEDDRHVALVVAGGKIAAKTVADSVATKQIAPTVLKALGIPVSLLTGVAAESTAPLPL